MYCGSNCVMHWTGNRKRYVLWLRLCNALERKCKALSLVALTVQCTELEMPSHLVVLTMQCTGLEMEAALCCGSNCAMCWTGNGFTSCGFNYAMHWTGNGSCFMLWF